MRSLISLILLFTLAATAGAAYERRNAALQLYQEGLFQETGTGDLTLADSIYASLIEHYPDYRDITAVAIYHCGLVCEKRGDSAGAAAWYRRLITDYPDQTSVFQQARAKLDAVGDVAEAGDQATTLTARSGHAWGAGGRPRRPVKPARPSVGIGLHYLGPHLRWQATPQLALELRTDRRDTFWYTGVRLYSHLGTPSETPLRPYVSYGYAQTSSSAGGYSTGVGTGAAWTLDRFNMHAGVGCEYQNLNPGESNHTGLQAVFEIGATYYLF